MSEEFIKEFKRFLKEEGIYKAFQQNFQPGFDETNGTDSSSLKSFLKTCSIVHPVSGAFGWGTTIQGFAFWENIYCKWSKNCYEEWKGKK